MGKIHQLRARAERSRRDQYGAPVVASVAEARALAARIAGELAEVSDREALLCLALLQDIDAVLTRRVERLQAEMAETGRELARAQDGASACRRYGQTATLTVHRPTRGG